MVLHFSLEAKFKKLYIHFICLIVSYLPLIYIKKSPKFKDSYRFIKLIRAISKTVVFVPFFISNKFFQKNRTKLIDLKNTRNDIIILIFFPIIYILSKIMKSFFKILGELINQVISLIILSFFMGYFSNFQFHRHNLLAVILFSIFIILVDILFYKNESFIHSTIITIILNAVYCLFYSIELNYRKYLMDDRYISFYKILSFCGLIDLFYFIIIKILSDKYGNFIYCAGEQVKITTSFEGIKTKTIIVILQALLIFTCYIIHITIFFLLIYHFSPAHAVVVNTIILSIQEIYYHKISNAFLFVLFLLLLIFSIIALFIYLEIIELNFCGLDKNIRKNILKRDKKDRTMSFEQFELGQEKEDNEIDLGNGYLFDINNNRNSF